MNKSRVLLLAVSTAVVLLLLGGGVAMKVGAADGSYRQVLVFSEVLSLVLDNYVDEVQPEKLLDGAYEGLLTSLGAEGAYLRPEEVQAWKQGKGRPAADPGTSVLKAFGALQVVQVFPGSPAERAGLKPGDQIRRIDGRTLRDLSLDQALRLLRGEPGSSVEVSLLLPREGFRRRTVTLQRAVRASRPYRLEVEEGIGVLSVTDLPRIPPGALASELEQAWSRGIRRLLIDLRRSADGGARESADVLGLFTAGEVLTLVDGTGETVETLRTEGTGSAWPGSVSVLVDSGTAGAGEAVARVLKLRRGARIYGETTYGLGVEARLFELDNGAGLLIPALVWEAPDGSRWDGEGIEPDLVIRAEGKPGEAEAEQLRRALEVVAEEPTRVPEEPASREAA